MEHLLEKWDELFEEKRMTLLEILDKKMSLSSKNKYLFSLLKRLPFPGKGPAYPLVNIYIDKLKKCNDNEDIEQVLLEILSVQTEYEYRNINKLKQNLQFARQSITSDLNLSLRDLSLIKLHEYQPCLEVIMKNIIRENELLNDVYDEAIAKLEDIIKQKEKS